MKADDRIRISHMLEAAESALGFCAGKSFQDLHNDRQLSFAIVRALEIVGEAASQLPADFRESNADIPWREIITMRNKLIHAYFDINFDIVWSTLTHDLPALIPMLKKIVEKP